MCPEGSVAIAEGTIECEMCRAGTYDSFHGSVDELLGSGGFGGGDCNQDFGDEVAIALGDLMALTFDSCDQLISELGSWNFPGAEGASGVCNQNIGFLLDPATGVGGPSSYTLPDGVSSETPVC